MTPRMFRAQLLSKWWSITRSLVALGFDRRMSIGHAEELVDALRDFGRSLEGFRIDVAENRFGSELVARDSEQ